MLDLPVSIRNPTVGPGCSTRSAASETVPAVQGLLGTSWNTTRAGTSRKSTGNSGGEKARRMRSRRLRTGEGGPRPPRSHARPTTVRRSEALRGDRDGDGSGTGGCAACRGRSARPREVGYRCPRRARPRFRPRARPRHRRCSRRRRRCRGRAWAPHPDSPRSSHERPSRLAAPEDRHDAHELVGVREQRKRRHLDLALDAVRAGDDVALMGRPPLIQGDPGRAPLGR